MKRSLCIALAACATFGSSGCLDGLSVPTIAVSPDLAPSPPPPPVVDLAEPPLDIFVPPPRPETCNSVDDDNDGVVDEGCPRQLESPMGTIWNARVSGDTILINTDEGVYVQHGIDGTPELVDSSGLDALLAGDWLTYQTYPSADSGEDVGGIQYVRNLETGVVYAVPIPRHYQNRRTSLGASWFAWSHQIESAGGNSDVFALDLKTGKTWTVAGDSNDSKTPLVDGDDLWFLDDRARWTSGWHQNGRYDVAISALPPASPRRFVTAFTDTTGYPWDWALFANSGFLYLNSLYSATSHLEPCGISRFSAATGESALLFARPLGEGCDSIVAVGPRWLVARRDVSSQGSTLRLYDLNTFKNVGLGENALEESRALTSYVTGIGSVSLSGDLLTWVDGRNGEGSVWAMDLSQIDKGEFHPEGQ